MHPLLQHDEPKPARTVRRHLPFQVGFAFAFGVISALWIVATRAEFALQRPVILYTGWLVLGTLIGIFGSQVARTRSDSDGPDRRRSNVMILLVAAALHTLVLVLHWPVLSDDVARYRFDGRQWVAGRNAYATTPQRVIDAGNADAIDRLTPHASTTTLYLPTSQAYFAGIAALEGMAHEPRPVAESDWRAAQPSLTWTGRVGVWRTASSLLALLCTAFLLRILRQLGRSVWWAAVFAWNPLTLIETAGSAHQDVLGIALMLGGLILWKSRRNPSGTFALAAAAFVKPIALLPMLATAEFRGRRSIRNLIFLALLLMVGATITLALGRTAILESLHRYGTTWEFNGGPFELFKWLMIEQFGYEPNAMKQHIRKAGALLVAIAAIILWRRKADLLSLSAWVMTASCLASPVLYPWYLLWPLALVATGTTAARWTILTWCGTSVLSYQVLREVEWVLPAPVMWAEYAPVIVALVADGFISWSASRRDAGARRLPSLT